MLLILMSIRRIHSFKRSVTILRDISLYTKNLLLSCQKTITSQGDANIHWVPANSVGRTHTLVKAKPHQVTTIHAWLRIMAQIKPSSTLSLVFFVHTCIDRELQDRNTVWVMEAQVSYTYKLPQHNEQLYLKKYSSNNRTTVHTLSIGTYNFTATAIRSWTEFHVNH